jgi:hypothetical protein
VTNSQTEKLRVELSIVRLCLAVVVVLVGLAVVVR